MLALSQDACVNQSNGVIRFGAAQQWDNRTPSAAVTSHWFVLRDL